MEHQSVNWDLVIKAKYGNILKRFNAFVKERRLDYDMAKLRSKIKHAFNLDPAAKLALSYEDDDGDIIALEQDEDLIDATINQQLNPLRIEVQLRIPNAELAHRSRNMSMSSYSTSANGPVVHELDAARRINWNRNEDIHQSFHSDHCGCHSSPHVCSLRPKKLKLKSRFVQDVTIPDGTRVSASTPFTKIWRMYNNGKDPWPYGTQLVWVGGNQIGTCHAVQLETPPTGFPVGQNINVQVDCMAPSEPGRYISFWRLVSPSGKKFGHCFWVLIKVDQPTFTLFPKDKYAGAGLLDNNAQADQHMRHVSKEHDMVGSSQQSVRPLIDLDKDSQNANSNADLGHYKDAVSEWGPLLAELHDMGFSDDELNRRLLVKYGGSIKRVVLDLIAREKVV